jgi:cell wall-associated NlpC family hydrolase
MNDVMLPRNASQQVNCGKEIEVPRKDTEGVTDDEDIKKGYTTKIAKSAIKNLKRGDLVFFGNTLTKKITHVGIYLGDGEIIHASHMVRINSLIPGEEDYYENAHRLIRACRLSH